MGQIRRKTWITRTSLLRILLGFLVVQLLALLIYQILSKLQLVLIREELNYGNSEQRILQYQLLKKIKIKTFIVKARI